MRVPRLRSEDHAHLVPVTVPDLPRGVVLVIHGGRSTSDAAVRWWQFAPLRMRSVATAIAHHDRSLAVFRLQLATRGWNGTGAAPMRDVRWGLDRVHARFPGRPVALVGHSMGARAALRVADSPGVAGVVGLAAWLPPDEPLRHLHGVPIRLIHGTADRIVPEASIGPWIARAVRNGLDLDADVLEHTGHAMLRRRGEWSWLAGTLSTDLIDHALTAGRPLAPPVRLPQQRHADARLTMVSGRGLTDRTAPRTGGSSRVSNGPA